MLVSERHFSFCRYFTRSPDHPITRCARLGMSAEKKFSILVVDDERSVLTTYGLILSRKGYDVETAISSVEAIQALNRRDFDLLLCDYSLEQEHTGFEVIDYGRKKKASTKAAILTGYASKDTAEQARQDGIAILYK